MYTSVFLERAHIARHGLSAWRRISHRQVKLTMTDVREKARALERLAATKTTAARNDEQEAKRQAFERLKTEAPDVAAFVSTVSSVFGRPAYIAIKFADGTVYRHGRQS